MRTIRLEVIVMHAMMCFRAEEQTLCWREGRLYGLVEAGML